MKFKYSVIGDNSQENREWLEKLGYKPGYVWSKDSNLIFAVDGTFCIDNTNAVYKYARIYDNLINCLGNPQLFQAVTAIREDSDYLQWFMCQTSRFTQAWYLCEEDNYIQWAKKQKPFLNSLVLAHKATLSDLIAHFKVEH